MTNDIRYEERDLESLLPDENNPRQISGKALAGLSYSIKRFGYVDLIVVNEVTGRMVGGHQRRHVLLDQGVKRAMVVVGRWTEDEERALSATLNNREIQGRFTDDTADYLAKALPGLKPGDLQELRLDSLLVKRNRDDLVSVIETGPVIDEFWLSVRGPLAGQADAIEAIKMKLREIPGVTVEVGTIKR